MGEAPITTETATVVWLTGLPCSGKTTIALLVAEQLRRAQREPELFDGDEVRARLSADLGFSPADRREQARRVAAAAAASLAAGRIPIVALVSPTRDARAVARELLGDAYLQVHVDAPTAVCEARDVKGMYREARAGTRPDFTGVSAPYERPRMPALRVCTGEEPASVSAQRVMDLLRGRGALG